MLFAIHPAIADNAHEWEEYLNDYCSMENIDASTLEDYCDVLYHIEGNPININTATREELELLPFLSDRNVSDIQEYVYRHGPMKTIGELAFITSLDYNQRMLLSFFAYPGEVKKPLFPSLKNILKYGKNELLASLKVPFYTRKGDDNGYQGYQYKHSFKYDFTYGSYLRLGFLGSQDAGEPFFAGVNSAGYDFYSFYVNLKKLGRVKTLVAGRYRLRFGLGLVVNNNRSYGKQSAMTTLQASGGNIFVHSSRSDANYLQGAAATVNVAKGLDVSAFVSYRWFDATLNKDGTISTILTSGYHRTNTEISKKNNSTNFTAGGNVSFRRNGFHVGATIAGTSLNRELKPNKSVFYRRHYASGRNFLNAGVDYGYICHRFFFSGETAVSDGGKGVATLNLLTINLSEKIDLTALQRYYSYKYHTLLGRTFSEGGAVQNENGVYVGLSWRPRPTLSVSAYADYAYFAWPKYQASQSSQCFDNCIQATWAPNRWTFTARYRLKFRQKDNDSKTTLIYKTDHRARFSAMFNSGSWQCRTQADMAYTQYDGRSFGWMLTENLCCTAVKGLRVNASVGYFHTDDYNSRVYTYERGLLYSFSVPSFYGHGVRYTMLANIDVIKNIRLTAKIGTSKYFDRNTIGSGYQLIAHSSATDLELQARWKI